MTGTAFRHDVLPNGVTIGQGPINRIEIEISILLIISGSSSSSSVVGKEWYCFTAEVEGRGTVP